MNDAEAVEIVRKAANTIGAKVEDAPTVLSAEDFGYYARGREDVESAFIFVGAAIADGVVRPHHSSIFDIEEKALVVSAGLFLQIVEDMCVSK